MTEDKKPDDAEFERAISFFLGSCEAQEVDMWDRYDVIKSYAHGYKKLYWDLLASWADLKVEHGVLMERAQPKYKLVDLGLKRESVPIDYKDGSHREWEIHNAAFNDGWNEAIDDIKSKYGDLFIEIKE